MVLCESLDLQQTALQRTIFEVLTWKRSVEPPIFSPFFALSHLFAFSLGAGVEIHNAIEGQGSQPP